MENSTKNQIQSCSLRQRIKEDFSLKSLQLGRNILTDGRHITDFYAIVHFSLLTIQLFIADNFVSCYTVGF